MTEQRVTGPRNTTHMRGVGAFVTPKGDDLTAAQRRGQEANRRAAELRRNPPEQRVIDWRDLV